MDVDNFYVVLPSNSRPDNTCARFRTTLATELAMVGEWECALVDITTPNNTRTILADDELTLSRTMPNSDEQLGWTFGMMRANYSKLEDMIADANTMLNNYNSTVGDYATFFEWGNNQIILKFNGGGVWFIDMTPNMAAVFGFDSKQLPAYNVTNEIFGIYPWDSKAGRRALYVYLDIIDCSHVGDSFVPLLRVVPIKESDARTDRQFTSPHYYRVSRKNIREIEVTIRDDTGGLFPFDSGKSVLKLHFRRRR